MATAKKHMERSHRSYHNAKPFAQFEAQATAKAYSEAHKTSFIEMLKTFLHKTTNK